MSGAIVVGYDGSEGSRAALEWATAEAVRQHAPLRIVECFELMLVTRPSTGMVVPLDALITTRERGLVALADELRASHQGLQVETALFDEGPSAVLVKESETSRMLVLGTRGLGGWTGLIVGSVSVQVAAHAKCPVIVVPADVRPRAREVPTVVVGVDGSQTSMRAVEFAFSHAEAHGERVLAVMAWTSPISVGGQDPLVFDPEQIEERLRITLAESLSGAEADHPDVKVDTRLMNGSAARVLLAVGESADLLVVGSRGRGGFAGLLLGSVSQGVLHHARCPVAIVR